MKTNKFFYTTGVDITNDKSMFNFLHNHFRYDTLNSWNGLKSIANNVKVYNLKLRGKNTTTLQFLNDFGYDEIESMINAWEKEHEGYTVFFNGRSSGYLVLGAIKNNQNILPMHIADYTYEEYKAWCKDFQDSVRGNRDQLVQYTKLVQDFDTLCDEIREYTDSLSVGDYAGYRLEDAINIFNCDYGSDLDTLGYDCLTFNDDGSNTVDVGEISQLTVLIDAFTHILDSRAEEIKWIYTDADRKYLKVSLR